MNIVFSDSLFFLLILTWSHLQNLYEVKSCRKWSPQVKELGRLWKTVSKDTNYFQSESLGFSFKVTVTTLHSISCYSSVRPCPCPATPRPFSVDGTYSLSIVFHGRITCFGLYNWADTTSMQRLYCGWLVLLLSSVIWVNDEDGTCSFN